MTATVPSVPKREGSNPGQIPAVAGYAAERATDAAGRGSIEGTATSRNFPAQASSKAKIITFRHSAERGGSLLYPALHGVGTMSRYGKDLSGMKDPKSWPAATRCPRPTRLLTASALPKASSGLTRPTGTRLKTTEAVEKAKEAVAAKADAARAPQIVRIFKSAADTALEAARKRQHCRLKPNREATSQNHSRSGECPEQGAALGIGRLRVIGGATSWRAPTILKAGLPQRKHPAH